MMHDDTNNRHFGSTGDMCHNSWSPCRCHFGFVLETTDWVCFAFSSRASRASAGVTANSSADALRQRQRLHKSERPPGPGARATLRARAKSKGEGESASSSAHSAASVVDKLNKTMFHKLQEIEAKRERTTALERKIFKMVDGPKKKAIVYQKQQGAML